MFCISNQNGKTSSPELIERLASCISESFEIDRKEISLNDPFHGGYITKTYGNNPLPWIQVEMNRDLYLSEPWFEITFCLIFYKIAIFLIFSCNFHIKPDPQS